MSHHTDTPSPRKQNMFCNDHQPCAPKHLLLLLPALAATVAMLALSAAAALATEPAPPCPNAQLRAEQPFASGLPDCRAYEMVSPLEKGDDGVSSVASRAAASGNAVSYFSRGSFEDPVSASLEGRYLSRRKGDRAGRRGIFRLPIPTIETNALIRRSKNCCSRKSFARACAEHRHTSGGWSARGLHQSIYRQYGRRLLSGGL